MQKIVKIKFLNLYKVFKIQFQITFNIHFKGIKQILKINSECFNLNVTRNNILKDEEDIRM